MTCLPSVSLPGMSFSTFEALITSQQHCHDRSFPEASLYLGSFQTTLVFTVKFPAGIGLMLTDARCSPGQFLGLSFLICRLAGLDESIALCPHPCSDLHSLTDLPTKPAGEKTESQCQPYPSPNLLASSVTSPAQGLEGHGDPVSTHVVLAPHTDSSWGTFHGMVSLSLFFLASDWPPGKGHRLSSHTDPG